MDIEPDEIIEDSIRSDLEQAFADSEPDSEKRIRDEAGKFAKIEKIEEPIVETPSIDIPNSWKNKDAEAWKLVPDAVKAEIKQRELEVEQGFTKLDEDRNLGKSLKEVITPYMSIIQAEGGTPATAVQSLLNTAYILRTAPQAQKTALFHQLAQQYGVDLSNSPTVQPDNVANLQNQIQQLQQQIQKQPEIFRQEQENLAVKSQIAAFSADPKNVHYEKLKPVMASLLTSGQAKDLQDAYDKASWADPEIRPSLLSSQTEEAKRIAETKAKTDKARKTAVSVKGAPSFNAVANGKSNGSIRDDLIAAFEAHS